MIRFRLLVVMLCSASIWGDGARAQMPPTLAAPGEAAVATIHAEGAQIYECKADSGGKITWLFREPVATLLLNGKTIGRHYAGPTWELTDGSAVTGKAVSNAPGATAADIPWLKLDVVNHRGNGLLSNVTTVQRINTRGGVAQGTCDQLGSFLSVPYSADYSFLSKEDQDHTVTMPELGR
jgi:Protein of unknown function (DUF3455)